MLNLEKVMPILNFAFVLCVFTTSHVKASMTPSDAREELEGMEVYDWGVKYFEAYTEGVINPDKNQNFKRFWPIRKLQFLPAQFESDFFNYGHNILSGEGARLKYLLPYMPPGILSLKNFQTWVSNFKDDEKKCAGAVIDKELLEKCSKYINLLMDHKCIQSVFLDSNLKDANLDSKAQNLFGQLKDMKLAFTPSPSADSKKSVETTSSSDSLVSDSKVAASDAPLEPVSKKSAILETKSDDQVQGPLISPTHGPQNDPSTSISTSSLNPPLSSVPSSESLPLSSPGHSLLPVLAPDPLSKEAKETAPVLLVSPATHLPSPPTSDPITIFPPPITSLTSGLPHSTSPGDHAPHSSITPPVIPTKATTLPPPSYPLPSIPSKATVLDLPILDESSLDSTESHSSNPSSSQNPSPLSPENAPMPASEFSMTAFVLFLLFLVGGLATAVYFIFIRKDQDDDDEDEGGFNEKGNVQESATSDNDEGDNEKIVSRTEFVNSAATENDGEIVSPV